MLVEGVDYWTAIGIGPIEELGISPFSDIMSSSYRNTVKINELIQAVNKLIELENSKLGK